MVFVYDQLAQTLYDRAVGHSSKKVVSILSIGHLVYLLGRTRRGWLSGHQQSSSPVKIKKRSSFS